MWMLESLLIFGPTKNMIMIRRTHSPSGILSNKQKCKTLMKVYNNLYNHLLTQAVSKAYGIKQDLNLWDIHSLKKYFKNKIIRRGDS